MIEEEEFVEMAYIYKGGIYCSEGEMLFQELRNILG
jgi:hypothetical protein